MILTKNIPRNCLPHPCTDKKWNSPLALLIDRENSCMAEQEILVNYEMRNERNLHPSVPKVQSTKSEESISYFRKALTELY